MQTDLSSSNKNLKSTLICPYYDFQDMKSSISRFPKTSRSFLQKISIYVGNWNEQGAFHSCHRQWQSLAITQWYVSWKECWWKVLLKSYNINTQYPMEVMYTASPLFSEFLRIGGRPIWILYRYNWSFYIHIIKPFKSTS